MSIKENIAAIKHLIPGNITLVAVSKFQDNTKILEAITSGQKIFAENRVQEAIQKWPAIKNLYNGIELHLIGALQTNKAADAVRLFDMIESLDRPKLADCLIKEMHKQNKFIPCLIQVNIGCEPQKSGILPEDADNFIKYCQDKGLIIKGLMCIPPENGDPTPHFQAMKQLCDKHNFAILSMGMSNDFKTAIECGATHIRIGTAIFGKR